MAVGEQSLAGVWKNGRAFRGRPGQAQRGGAVPGRRFRARGCTAVAPPGDSCCRCEDIKLGIAPRPLRTTTAASQGTDSSNALKGKQPLRARLRRDVRADRL